MSIEILTKNSKYSAKITKAWSDQLSNKASSRTEPDHPAPRSRPRSAASLNSSRSIRSGRKEASIVSDSDDDDGGVMTSSVTSKGGVSAMKMSLLSQQAAHLVSLLACLEKVVAPIDLHFPHNVRPQAHPISFFASWGVPSDAGAPSEIPSTLRRRSSSASKNPPPTSVQQPVPNVSVGEVFDVVEGYISSYLKIGQDTTGISSPTTDSGRNNASTSSRPVSAAEFPSNDLLAQQQHAFLRVVKVLTQVLTYCQSRIQPLSDLRRAAGVQLDGTIREFTQTASTLSEAGKVTGTSSLARRNSVVSKAHQSRYEEALQSIRVAVLAVLHNYSRLRQESISLDPSHRLYGLETSLEGAFNATRGYLQERLAKLQRTMRASLPQQLQAALLSLPIAGGPYFVTVGSEGSDVPTGFSTPILPRDIPDFCATPFLLHSRIVEYLTDTEDTSQYSSQVQHLVTGIRIYLSTLDVGGSGKSKHDVVPDDIREEDAHSSLLLQMDGPQQDAPPGGQGLRLLKPLHTASRVNNESPPRSRPLSSQGRSNLLAPIAAAHNEGDPDRTADVRGTYPPVKQLGAPYLIPAGKGRKGSRGGVVVQRLVDYRASRSRCPEALTKAHTLEISTLRIQLWWALVRQIRIMRAEAILFIPRRHSSIATVSSASDAPPPQVEAEVREEEALQEYEGNVEWCRARQHDLIRESEERENQALLSRNQSAAVIQRFLSNLCQCKVPKRQLTERLILRERYQAVRVIEQWWGRGLPARRRQKESRDCQSGQQREFFSRQRLAVVQHKHTWDRILASVDVLQSSGRGYLVRCSRVPTTSGDGTTPQPPRLSALRYNYYVVRKQALLSRFGRRWLAITRVCRQRAESNYRRQSIILRDAASVAAIKIGKFIRGFICRRRFAHLQIKERIFEGNFRRAIAARCIDPTTSIPPFPERMRIAGVRITRFVRQQWCSRVLRASRSTHHAASRTIFEADRQASAILILQNTLYRGLYLSKRLRHEKRLIRDEAALRKELDELESQNTVGSLFRRQISAKGADLTEDKIACRTSGLSSLSLPRPSSAALMDGDSSVRDRYQFLKTEIEAPIEEEQEAPIATSEVMRRHLKRIQRVDYTTIAPISFPLPKVVSSSSEGPFMQALTDRLFEQCSPQLLFVLRVALCSDIHSRSYDHNALLRGASKAVPARHSVRMLAALRELGQDQIDRQWLSTFEDDELEGDELEYSCASTQMAKPDKLSPAARWAQRGHPHGSQPRIDSSSSTSSLEGPAFTPTIESSWSNAAAVAAEISEYAAVAGWRAIFSRTTYDLYKQNVVAEDKSDKRERFQRVYVDRNVCIQSCYRVNSEEKWLLEVSKDIRKAGEVYKPARPDTTDDENEVEERRLSAFYFTFDFISQCFPRVFEDSSRDANECLSDNLPAYLIVLAVQHLVASKLCGPGGEEFSFALDSLLPPPPVLPESDCETDQSGSSDSPRPVDVDLGVRLVMFLFGGSDSSISSGEGDAVGTAPRGLMPMFANKAFVQRSLLDEHPLD